MPAAAKPSGAVILDLDSVEARAVEWLWPGRIPLGKLTVIAGDGGCGKSTLTVDIAARVTTGKAWPDQAGTPTPGGVVVLSAEDDPADTIRPRMDAHDADCSRVKLLRATVEAGKERMVTLEDLPSLEQAIDATPGCRLVIVDPVTAYGPDGLNDHSNTEIRAMLAPISELAERKRVAIVAVHHLNKGGNGMKALYRMNGSIAWGAAARSAWGVTIDPNDDAANPADRRRLFVPLKMNTGRPGSVWGYHILEDYSRRVGVVHWEPGPAEGFDADSAFGEGRKNNRPTPAQDAAEEFLREALANGPVAVADLKEFAKNAGVAWRSVERVKVRLRVAIEKDGFQGPSMWLIPGSDLFHPETATAP